MIDTDCIVDENTNAILSRLAENPGFRVVVILNTIFGLEWFDPSRVLYNDILFRFLSICYCIAIIDKLLRIKMLTWHM